MNPIEIQSSAFSLSKTINENGDFFALNKFNDMLFCAIADGVGNSYDPGQAATIATSHAEYVFSKNTAISMKELFQSTKKNIVEIAKSQNSEALKTTLTICILNNGIATVGHVGDARIYHLRDGGLVTRTKDQTEVQHLIDEGILSPERAKNYPRKNVLLSALSSESDYVLFENSFKTQTSDRLLFLTDGAYKILMKKDILVLSESSSNIEELINKLKLRIVSDGYSDDATILGIEFI